MKRLLDIFRIRREERLPALLILLILVALNALVIYKYYGVFTPLKRFYWPLFIHRFHVSGFDPITYAVVSDWSAGYNVYRHPFLAFYMYVPYLINQGLMFVTGKNCAIFIVAVMLVFCAFYSFIFFFRILRDVIGIAFKDSVLLSFFFFSFAFVMLSCMAPDHFVISMMLLLLALYISGRRIKNKHKLKKWQSILYFMLTAGTSLNNGLKIFFSGLFVNGKRFFSPKYLFIAVICPALLIWGFSKWEYATLVWPQETARHAAKAKKKAEQQKRIAFADSVKRANADTIAKSTKPVADVKKKAKRQPKQGTPIANGEFMRWTDITTSRWQSAVENLFGESIQLHRDYLLEDEFHHRPMIVHYKSPLNYVVEALVVLLFIVGIWCGRRSRFFWLCMSYFGLDMILHMGLGFGLNEVYIMSAHWIYVVPIAVAYLMISLRPDKRLYLRGVLFSLTTFLWVYNVMLITRYMIH